MTTEDNKVGKNTTQRQEKMNTHTRQVLTGE